MKFKIKYLILVLALLLIITGCNKVNNSNDSITGGSVINTHFYLNHNHLHLLLYYRLFSSVSIAFSGSFSFSISFITDPPVIESLLLLTLLHPVIISNNASTNIKYLILNF